MAMSCLSHHRQGYQHGQPLPFPASYYVCSFSLIHPFVPPPHSLNSPTTIRRFPTTAAALVCPVPAVASETLRSDYCLTDSSSSRSMQRVFNGTSSIRRWELNVPSMPLHYFICVGIQQSGRLSRHQHLTHVGRMLKHSETVLVLIHCLLIIS